MGAKVFESRSRLAVSTGRLQLLLGHLDWRLSTRKLHQLLLPCTNHADNHLHTGDETVNPSVLRCGPQITEGCQSVCIMFPLFSLRY